MASAITSPNGSNQFIVIKNILFAQFTTSCFDMEVLEIENLPGDVIVKVLHLRKFKSSILPEITSLLFALELVYCPFNTFRSENVPSLFLLLDNLPIKVNNLVLL
jgi:hypothetical protein